MELAFIVTTAISVVLAAAMAIVAWRLARIERVRSEARLSAQAAQLADAVGIGGQAVVGIRGERARLRQVAPSSSDFSFDRRLGRASAPAAEILQARAADRSPSRLATVLAVGTFAVAASLALVIATSRGEPTIVDWPASSTTAPAPPAATIPLELLALRHHRDRDRITIRGVVRNPPGAENVEQLTAVASLFDRDGGVVGNGASALAPPALGPGAESGFLVSVGHAATVARYRVSFRVGNRVVPHVDRRSLKAPEFKP